MTGAVAAAVASFAFGASTPFAAGETAFWDFRHGLAVGHLVNRDGSYGRAEVRLTRDGGRTWRTVTAGRGPFDVTTLRTGGAGWIASPAGLLATRDRGLTWRRVRRRPVWHAAFATARIGWALMRSWFGEPSVLVATRDGGRTWRRLRSPCPRSVRFQARVSRPSPARGWILCLGQPGAGQQLKALYETRDAGRSWRVRARSLLDPPAIGNLSGGYALGIDFLPDGRGWLWASRGSFMTTSDGGRRWRSLPISSPEVVEAYSATRLSRRSGIALIGHDGPRLGVTRDGGRTWRFVHRFG